MNIKLSFESGLFFTIFLAVVYSILLFWFSRRWIQKQHKLQTIKDIAYVGKGYPSPILTIILRFYRSIPDWFISFKQGCKSFTFRTTKLIRLCMSVIIGIVIKIKRAFINFLPDVNRFIMKWLEKSSIVISTGLKQRLLGAIRNLRELLVKLLKLFKRIKWIPVLEISLIIAWAFFIGRKCLNFSPNRNLVGSEYINLLQSHFIWTVLPKCGTCVFWNGFINGGAPSFVDTLGAPLHPLVILTTLTMGAINGSRLVLIGSLALAGISQWWLARTMKLGWFSRMWAAVIIQMGGHLIGKMDNGNVILVLSTASASFCIAAFFSLVQTHRKSSLLLSGIGLGFLILSGQGYIQIGMAFAVFPLLCIFLFDSQLHLNPIWKDIALSVLIGLLIAGVFLVPLLHFLPNMFKATEPTLSNYQPLQYLPLNLVINDLDLFHTSALGHDGNFYTNYIYIGWFSVILAIFAIPLFLRKQKRIVLFFVIGILQIFILCSKEFSQGVISFIPGIANVRWGSIISGLSVPFIVGLAAWSLDHLLKSEWWLKLILGLTKMRVIYISLSFFFLAIPAITSMNTSYQQSKIWLNDYAFELNNNVIKELTPISTQWVSPQFGDYSWMRVLLEQGGKLTRVWRPWFWRDRKDPPPYSSAIYKSENTDESNVVAIYDEIEVMRQPENQYASVIMGDGKSPCKADATGGLIRVACKNAQDGTLIVEENQWDGWTASMDGSSINLKTGDFLSVDAPSGNHTYEFKYQPWDVWVGLGLSGIGWLLVLYLLLFYSTGKNKPGYPADAI